MKFCDVTTEEIGYFKAITGSQVYKEKCTVAKYLLNERARKMCQNFQLGWEVQRSLVHLALKLLENVSFSD